MTIILTVSCKKEESKNDLSGMWVRQNYNSDTIIFGNDNYFELRRGYILDSISNHQIPITPCGLYFYELSVDSIFIHWEASSYIAPEQIPIYFKLMDKRFEIENFIDTAELILIFDQIE